MVGENIPEVMKAVKELISEWSKVDPDATALDNRRANILVRNRVQATFIPRSMPLIFADQRLCFDPYAEILLCDIDPKIHRREIIVQVMGEINNNDSDGIV